MSKRFDIALLDADETIFDFKKAEAVSLCRSLENISLEFSEERLKLYSDINLSCWKALERGELLRERLVTLRFEKFFDAIGVSGVDCAAFHDSYIHNLAQSGFLIDGAFEFIKKLSEDCDIYITTNGLTIPQTGRLERSPIKPYIKGIYISEQIGFQKPDKEYFDYVFADLKVSDRSRTVIIGDSLTSDMLGGRNAGITTCRYLGDNPHEDSDLVDYEIRSFDEFFSILYK